MKMNVVYMVMLTIYSRMLLKQADLLQSINEIIDVDQEQVDLNSLKIEKYSDRSQSG